MKEEKKPRKGVKERDDERAFEFLAKRNFWYCFTISGSDGIL